MSKRFHSVFTTTGYKKVQPMSETQLQTVQKSSAFSMESFDHAQRIAKMLSSSSLVPKDYQGRVDNCLIALEMSNRSGSSPLMVMQNLHIIQGKPSWSSPYTIAAINASGKFSSDLRFRKSGDGDEYGYEAYAIGKDGQEITGPKVTWKMVKDEGWLGKQGSKWKTMPELMFRYRSAAFFGRLYTPDILMGMHTVEETLDVTAVVETPNTDKESERIFKFIEAATTLEELEQVSSHLKEEHLDSYTVKKDSLKK